MLRIALIFHSARNDNLGVGALTVSEVEIIRAAARKHNLDVEIAIVAGISSRPAYVTGNDIRLRDSRPLRRPLDFFKAMRDCDLVIDIGGGDSFADIYGRKRLFKMLLMKYLAHLGRRPLVMAPQTVGPFRSRLSRTLARQSIRRCALVATRDAMSTDCLREMGIQDGIIEASDVALRLPYDPPLPAGDAAGPVKVGLNVSGLLMQGGYTRDNMFGLTMDYPALIHSIIRDFLDHPDGCEVHLVPHVIGWKRGGVEDDYQACLQLADTFPEIRVAPAFATPSEAKSYIAGMDFFAGARMHACIAAFSAGVPVVPMAYSRKFAGMFGSLSYNHTVDCTRDDAQSIRARILAAYEARAKLKEDTYRALRRGEQKLEAYEAALGALIEQLAQH